MFSFNYINYTSYGILQRGQTVGNSVSYI